jgi:hypothetical protein
MCIRVYGAWTATLAAVVITVAAAAAAGVKAIDVAVGFHVETWQLVQTYGCIHVCIAQATAWAATAVAAAARVTGTCDHIRVVR